MSLKLDQAARLRNLMRRSDIADSTNDSPRGSASRMNAPHIVTLCSGKPGVGVTSISLNLAISMAEQGQRVIVVDAAMNRSDLTSLCKITASETIEGILDGRRTMHEVLQNGPCGIQILPGSSVSGCVPDCSPHAQDRLLGELRRLGKYADVIVIDVGSGMTQVMRRFWEASDAIINVVVPETLAIMDCYAMIKLLHRDAPHARIGSLVNCAEDYDVARRVQAKIEEVLRRFCQYTVIDWGWLPNDTIVAAAPSEAKNCFSQVSSDLPISKQLDLLAKNLLAQLKQPYVQNELHIDGVSDPIHSMVLAELPLSV